MDVSVLGTSYVDSFLVDTLTHRRRLNLDISQIQHSLLPATAGLYRAQAFVTIAENDTVADDDTAYTQIMQLRTPYLLETTASPQMGLETTRSLSLDTNFRCGRQIP